MGERNRKKVLIIGAGEIGRALDFVLRQNSANQVLLWDRKPEKVKDWRPLDEAIISFEPEFIFLAVPTKAIAKVVKKVLLVRRENFCLVLLSKGLGDEGKTSLEIVQEFWLGPTVVFSGPMLAEELAQGLKAEVMIAANLPERGDRLAQCFNGTNLSLEKTTDLVGLSWCGPLKNIYAIGLGAVEAGGQGSNYKGWFIANAVKEMSQLIEFFGGRRKTAYSLAGIGDLVATGFSPYSSNYQFGISLEQKKKIDYLPEGVVAALGLKKRLEEKTGNWPLLEKIIIRVDQALK